MRCPNCGFEFINPDSQAAGRRGGAARVAKGFASPAVLAKALATRARKCAEKQGSAGNVHQRSAEDTAESPTPYARIQPASRAKGGG
jgi:hypothetical protein